LKFLVSQIGAREHYSVPRALHQQGMLAALVTDWYAFGGDQSRKQKIENRNEKMEKRKAEYSQRFSVLAFQYFGGRGRAALAARADGIPDELVRAFPFRSLLWKWRVCRLAAQGRSHEAYLQTDSAFASAVARLKLPEHEVFFGYSYASLETLEAEKKRGVLTVLDQIDPGAVEFRIVADEMKQHPEIAGPPPEFPAANFDRNRREWELADVIVVNSEWTREAIIAEGADRAKIEILPLAYETAQSAQGKTESRKQKVEMGNKEVESGKEKAENRKQKSQNKNEFQLSMSRQSEAAAEDFSISAFPPLRVLWLGQVNVRKGIHYLMAAAKLLANELVHFNVVGSIGILPAAVASAPRSMTFHGPVSRDRAAEWYRQSDVFVLPTLSDGFAITQLEAMAHGLPVVTTPCCGDVVSDGVDGFIVPPRDADALARTLQRYLKEPKLLLEQRNAAVVKSRQFTLDHLSANLLRLEAALGDRR
jgi:glycosyltransferase involved in cell wall biosynthesis